MQLARKLRSDEAGAANNNPHDAADFAADSFAADGDTSLLAERPCGRLELRLKVPWLFVQGAREVRFSFEGRCLDPDRRERERSSELIAIGPTAFDLLLLLIQIGISRDKRRLPAGHGLAIGAQSMSLWFAEWTRLIEPQLRRLGHLV
ncbi:hypothetical protein [Bradyrhizobium sp. STM 3557]|uniref:hypothetical protein n=1 Tax=Bradyrhizobium sp. STM 3557 TaxID=578920 RepID=UPI00388F12DC